MVSSSGSNLAGSRLVWTEKSAGHQLAIYCDLVRKRGLSRLSVAAQPNKVLSLPLTDWVGEAEGDRRGAVTVVDI